jgi:hypothetical protein
MKTCPGCDRDYTDDTLNFCLMCGMPLADGNAQPTVAIGAGETITRAAYPTGHSNLPTEVLTAEAKPQKSRAPWIMLGLFVAGVAVICLGLYVAAMWQVRSNSNAAADGPRFPAAAKPSKTAANSVAPRLSPTPEVSPVGGDDEAVSDTPEDWDQSEATPIVWSTAAMTFNGEPGQVAAFECPPNGEASPVWGSDLYSTGSSICTAAVHSGKIDLEFGGRVTIEYRPGRKLYGATTRNGITTDTYGEFVGSFVFVDDRPRKSEAK